MNGGTTCPSVDRQHAQRVHLNFINELVDFITPTATLGLHDTSHCYGQLVP